MDLGIKGKRAIVCASSKGLGRGVAEKLAEAGVNVTLNARGGDALEQTARHIAKTYGVEVRTVATDVTTVEGRAELLKAEPWPDILINNAGGPPAGSWTDWDDDTWRAAIENNTLAPILLMKAVLPQMKERKWGRIVNITSASVKAPIQDLELSNTARTGLTGFVASVARQVAKHGITINNLLPGSHETARINAIYSKVAETKGISFEAAIAEARLANPTGRFGTAEEFGAAAAFLCSNLSGYIVGQNLLLDGGAFSSTMG